MNYAIFVRRFHQGTGKRMFWGHLYDGSSQNARKRARELMGVTVRSCDMIEVARDNVRFYGQRGAGSFTSRFL